jgi:hypothetical protein
MLVICLSIYAKNGDKPLSAAADKAELAATVFCKASSFCSFPTKFSTSAHNPVSGLVLFNVSMYWAISTIWSMHSRSLH